MYCNEYYHPVYQRKVHESLRGQSVHVLVAMDAPLRRTYLDEYAYRRRVAWLLSHSNLHVLCVVVQNRSTAYNRVDCCRVYNNHNLPTRSSLVVFLRDAPRRKGFGRVETPRRRVDSSTQIRP